MSTQSHTYRSKLKKLVTLIKSLYPTLHRIPKPLPRPGTDAFKMGNTGNSKADAARKEGFAQRDARRLDSSVPRYFLEAASFDDVRRNRS